MDISNLFSSMVFDDKVMRERLPADTYDDLRSCCVQDKTLPLETANVIANAMKNWAIEKGVTHFTHWFQPLTGITAEKHDSFISPTQSGGVIMEFSGKELIKGEPDASSFPSGGLRATFEARGYTAWDPTSFAFIKDGILCIPTAFCSYNGAALDKKTPLLRSMQAINREATRLLHLFGRRTQRVDATVGPEQEYFLIDTEIFNKRVDLIFTGRTLFGARPPKGQELEDHYFGSIKPRVAAFMKELDEELWKVGVLAKTKHNEVAPAQHELAPIFTTVNVATDQNQLTMEFMKKLAAKHGMTCLLHEKPFAGVNGSGKHNNWSLSTNFGHNLFSPGRNPEDSAQFLLIIAGVIAAVDKYQDLLRVCVASAGNDHRLGAQEAPPAIVSMFLGEELTGILQCIADGRNYSKRADCYVDLGATVLPKFKMDSTDRNRTSPFAFTGNKFEFRMLGSSFSIADANVILNTILADEFMLFSNELENATDFLGSIKDIIKRVMQKHGRIIFNGNNYTEEWVADAKKRGLLNLATTMDALPLLTAKKNVELFVRQNVFTEQELKSRQDILIENYCRLLSIEAMTMLDMAVKSILPATLGYIRDLAKTAKLLFEINVDNSATLALVKKLNSLYETATQNVAKLKKEMDASHLLGEGEKAGLHFKTNVLPAMAQLRATADEMEKNTAKSYWPFPTYSDILFSVN
jgi:glutamine synthetase